jgi:hypothetical protein
MARIIPLITYLKTMMSNMKRCMEMSYFIVRICSCDRDIQFVDNRKGNEWFLQK